MSTSPAVLRLPVGVVVERRKAGNPWIDFTWRPVTVLHGEPATAAWTQLSADTQTATFYAGAAEIALYPSETARYRDNLAAGPALWVVMRPTGVEPPYHVAAVTADPAEGEGYTAAGSDLVEPVPMPDSIRDIVAAYVAEHHVEQPIFKRKRDRANPDALARRSRTQEDE